MNKIEELIRRLIQLLESSNLEEIEVEEDGRRVRVKKPTPGSSPVVSTQQITPSPSPPIPEGDADGYLITSPFVGTFFRAPAPDAAPFINEGDVIQKGDVLCIIEAMKLMNEIESDISGSIKKILVGNGPPVEYGQAL